MNLGNSTVLVWRQNLIKLTKINVNLLEVFYFYTAENDYFVKSGRPGMNLKLISDNIGSLENLDLGDLCIITNHYANIVLFTSLCAIVTCFPTFLDSLYGGDRGLRVITATAVRL